MTWFRFVWLLVLCGGLSLSATAQKVADLKKNGEKSYADGRWQDALQQLAQYQEQKPGDLGVLSKLGVVYYHVHKPDQARKYMEYVIGQRVSGIDAEVYYYYARTLHGLGEYEKAIAAYKSFLRVCGDNHPLRAGIPDQIRRCVNAQAIPESETVALVENLGGQVNTPGDEFAPLPSASRVDRLYFAAARPGSTGGMRNADGYEDQERGSWCADMMAANQQKGGWETDGNIGSLLNASRHEVALTFGRNGNILYFLRGFTLFSAEILADTAGRKDEYALTTPAFNSPMRPEEGDCAPFIFNDTLLLFASRREGGEGGLDLYAAVFGKNGWSEPFNLGPEINTPYDETTPFLSLDGSVLYYSGNHPQGMGGLDVYTARFDRAKKTWQTPLNMGSPVNSPDDEENFRLSADGTVAYFDSDRLVGFGQRDIYVAYFKSTAPGQDEPGQAAFLALRQPAQPVDNVPEVLVLKLPPLSYDSDKDILSTENQKTLEQLAAGVRRQPDLTVVVTVHTDPTGPMKFDLYNGIKRAEIVGKALMERGIPAGRIQLRSAGPAYPVARNVVDAAPNPVGRKLNRRIELSLATRIDNPPVQVQPDRPVISELMSAAGGAQFDRLTSGLYYSVEVAVTRQILNNDALDMFSDLLIETQPGSGMYHYTVGLFGQYQKAAALKAELIKQGFNEASVTPHLNGLPVSKAEAVGMIKKYPDLINFMKG